MKVSKLLPALVLLLLLVPGDAQALENNLSITSSSGFAPGEPVVFNITGTSGMGFNIRITDTAQNIVGGRDAALNEFGSYDYTWTPPQEGEYNVTVTYATGLSITKTFLIQYKVTARDISEIYRAIYNVQNGLKALIENLDGKVNISLALGVFSLLVSLGVFVWAKRNISPAESEFEKLMREVVQSAQAREVARLRKLVETKADRP